MSRIKKFKKEHAGLLNVMGKQSLNLLSAIEGMGYLYESYKPQISMLSIGINISDKDNPQLLLEFDSEIGKQRFELPVSTAHVDEVKTEKEKLEFDFVPVKE
jgi:hypothetical protein